MADTTRKLNIWINGKQVEDTFAGITNAMRKSRNELAHMETGSKEYIEQTKKIRQLQGLMDDHKRMQGQIAQGWIKVKGNMMQVAAGNFLANAFQSIGSTIMGVFTSAFNTIKEFGKAVSELQAITGASGKDLDFLKQKAKDLAATYGTSAVEIIEAMKMVGSAKPELLENVDALSMVTDAVLTLSKASGMDLASSTENLATIMNQFGHDATKANEDINILAAGAKYGSVEIDYLGQAISKVGTVANSAGLSLETVTAAMELFGEKGVKAEVAGTGFKSILIKLQSDTNNYTNGLFDLNKAIENNQSISTDNIALQKKFGAEYFNLAQILFQGKDRFNELNKQVTGTNVAFEQAAINMDNLSGDIDKAGGAWDKFVLGLDDGSGIISKAVRGVIGAFTDLMTDLDTINSKQATFAEKTQSWADTLGFIFVGLGGAVKKFRDSWNYLFDDGKLSEQQIEEAKERGRKAGEVKYAAMKLQAEKEKQIAKGTTDDEKAEADRIKKEKIQDSKKLNEEAKRIAAEKKRLADEEKKRMDEYYKNYKKMSESILQLRKDMNGESLTEEEKQIQELENKYDSQLGVVKGFIDELEKKKGTRAGLNEEENALLANFYAQQYELIKMSEEDIVKLLQSFDTKKMEQTTDSFNDMMDAINSNNETSQYLDPNNAVNGEAKTKEDGMIEKIKTIIKYAGMAASALSSLYEIQSNKQAAELAEYEASNQKKKDTLDKRLKRGLISEDNYNKQVAALDKKLDTKKKEFAIEEAKRQKRMRIFEAIINTASAVVEALPNIPLSIASGALGLFQIAAIASQPIPKAAKGMRVNKPTILEAGEAGREIILSNSIVDSPTLGPIADDLARIQEGKQPRFLGKPNQPNFGGMKGAITSSGSVAAVTNNTVINQVNNEAINIMGDKLELMTKKMDETVTVMKNMKYIQAIIKQDQITEFDNDEKYRLRYSNL